MNELICPVCGFELFGERVYKCKNNHCFDVSKYGVLNLALSNKSSKKRHGDDKLMILARKNFLDGGYYQTIRDSVNKLIENYCRKSGVLLDAGCGEGYYTKAAAEVLQARLIYGIDISKEALRYFKKRINTAVPIVSSIFRMPIKTESIDVALNMFAPCPNNEFLRILKKDGYLIRTFVLKNHLIELKRAIYDKAYYNDAEDENLDGFIMLDKIITEEKIIVDGENISNLFQMTPYYYKTSIEDQKKIENLEQIEITIHVATAIYKKRF